MKKKYIKPAVELECVELSSCILAGSPGSDYGIGGGNNGEEGETKKDDGDALSKQNQFSTWEDWDEY